VPNLPKPSLPDQFRALPELYHLCRYRISKASLQRMEDKQQPITTNTQNRESTTLAISPSTFAMETIMNVRLVSAFALSLALLATVPVSVAFAQNDSGAKQSMKNAGTETKDAVKDAGHGVKQGTKKAYHKTKRGVKKVHRKMDPDTPRSN
jgi:hypothetical protein